MKQSKMGMKAKMLTLVGGAVFAFGGMAVYAIYTMNHLKEEVEVLGLQRIPISEYISDIRAGSNGVPRFLWLSLAYAPGSPERAKSLEKVGEFMEIWDKGVAHIEDYPLTAKAKQKIGEIKDLMPKLKEVIVEAKKDLAAGTREQDSLAKELLIKQMPPMAVKLTEQVRDLSNVIKERNDEIVRDSQAGVAQAIMLLVGISIGLGAALSVFGFFFASRLARQLLQITESVAEASHQVSAASSQLSNAAEQLSSASQEQAAATEETSASLTQISGMVESNVQGAEKANECAREVHEVSEETKKSMEELKTAMNQINESNGRIEALVKVIEEIGEKTEVIDDIVFKTQLLSFNASVEAERAGEHGRGFAVVAQEVGNLAQMSGKAATEIAGIVKQSIKEATSVAAENKTRVEKGEVLAGSTSEKMTEVLSSLSNILDGTNKIVAASKEQSQGISQISTSVDGMNQSTQEIAGTAEESASASEELSGQAQSLLALVEELRVIVTGEVHEQEKTNHLPSKTYAKPELKGKVVSIQQHKKTAPYYKGNSLKKAVGSDLATSAMNDEWEKL